MATAWLLRPGQQTSDIWEQVRESVGAGYVSVPAFTGQQDFGITDPSSPTRDEIRMLEFGDNNKHVAGGRGADTCVHARAGIRR